MKNILSFFIAMLPFIVQGQINTMGTAPRSLTLSPKGFSTFATDTSDNIILGNENKINFDYQKIAIGKKAGAGRTYSILGIGNSALELNTSNYVIGIGVEVGKNNKHSNNIFIGDRAGKNLQNRFPVNVIGYNTLLRTKNIGYVNAIGAFSVANLADTVARFHNDALGFEAQYGGNTRPNNKGVNNLSMGALSLFEISSGSNNMALGYQAGSNISNGGGNIFIGYRAGSLANGDSKLFISNSSTNSPLIKGDFVNPDNLSLKINSKLQIGGFGHDSENTLDVRGDFILAGRGSISSSVNDYILGGKSVIYVSGGGTYDLTGIAGGKDGLLVYLIVEEGTNLNILEQDPLSLAPNRIFMKGAFAQIITNGGAATLIYDGLPQRWRYISKIR